MPGGCYGTRKTRAVYFVLGTPPSVWVEKVEPDCGSEPSLRTGRGEEIGTGARQNRITAFPPRKYERHRYASPATT
jgi:hypothetical protein